MEKQIRINEKIIKRKKTDDFAVQNILKGLDVVYEYKIEGTWKLEKPNGKPEGKRILFENKGSVRAGLDTYLAYENILRMGVNNPVFPEKIVQRLLSSRQAEFVRWAEDSRPLCLFVPWGIRPEGKFGKPEEKALAKIGELRNNLQERGINARILIMPADLYATEINRQINKDVVTSYINDLTNCNYSPTYTVMDDYFIKPWSAIREENITMYEKRAAELTNEEIIKILGTNIIKEALEASGRRSGYDSQAEIGKAAFAYLRERICEAEIIEGVYNKYDVIKVSAASKNKDNGVDRNLPRIYILPQELQFPWLK